MHHPLSSVNGVYNAVFVNSDAISEAMFLGLGAGRPPPTALLVLYRGDIIEIARNMVHHSGARINCTCFKEKKSCVRRRKFLLLYIFVCGYWIKPGALVRFFAFGAPNVSLRNEYRLMIFATQKAESVVIPTAFLSPIYKWHCRY